MARSSTSFARLRSELLAAREAREALLSAILAEATVTIVFASTAVPGPCKCLPGGDALLRWGANRLDDCRTIRGGFDVLGPYAVLAVAAEPRAAKRACLAIENGHPAARLLDLDVYGLNGVRVGRTDLSEPARPCLICEQPAVDCIRLQRHPMEVLVARAESLLAMFHAAAAG